MLEAERLKALHELTQLSCDPAPDLPEASSSLETDEAPNVPTATNALKNCTIQ